MTDTPEGFKRDEDGILHYVGGIGARFSDRGEACKMGGRFVCTTTVYSTGSFFGHCCDKSPKHDPDHNGNPTKCGIHSDAAKAKRKAKSDEKYRQWQEKSKRRAQIVRLQAEQGEIIEQIAAGHNDPRSLCQDWLDRMEKVKGNRDGSHY